VATDPPHRDITVIGASAGGVEALQTLIAALPRDYPGTLFVVVHVAADSPGMLPSIFARAGRLPVLAATDGATFERGQVFVAPPDRHLVLEQGRMRVAGGPRENRHRPAIDVLFRSAAIAYGPRVIGVVLTGMLDDGTAGLWAVKMRGGVAVVQDPADAMFPQMPQNALDAVNVDHCLPLAQIAHTLVRVAREPALAIAAGPDDSMNVEVDMASQTSSSIAQLDRLGTRSEVTCPECGGALWQLQQPQQSPRFRCHVGHAYSLRTLIAAQTERVESALWAGLRGLEESEALARRMRDSARARGHTRSAQLYDERVQEQARHADMLREMLRRLPGEAMHEGASAQSA
jgi:two-component system chemotaxis response regulator CheB